METYTYLILKKALTCWCLQKMQVQKGLLNSSSSHLTKPLTALSESVFGSGIFDAGAAGCGGS